MSTGTHDWRKLIQNMYVLLMYSTASVHLDTVHQTALPRCLGAPSTVKSPTRSTKMWKHHTKQTVGEDTCLETRTETRRQRAPCSASPRGDVHTGWSKLFTALRMSRSDVKARQVVIWGYKLVLGHRQIQDAQRSEDWLYLSSTSGMILLCGKLLKGTRPRWAPATPPC